MERSKAFRSRRWSIRPTIGRDPRDHHGRAHRDLRLVRLAWRPRCGAVGGRAAGARYRHRHGDGRQAVHGGPRLPAHTTSGGSCCTWSTRRPAGFKTVAVMPGNYELVAKARGLESDPQPIVVKAGDNPAVKVAMQRRARIRTSIRPRSIRVGGRSANGILLPKQPITFASYEEIYPAGPGLDVLENTLHGLPRRELLPDAPAQRRRAGTSASTT